VERAAERIASQLRPGDLVAVGDGAGAPVGLATAITDAAEATGGVSLLLGWCFEPPVDLGRPVFRDVRALMGGPALRGPIREGLARYIPVRYGALPALLRGRLRADVLVASLVPVDGGFSFATEVGWQHEAVAAGARVLAELNHGLPHAAGAPAIPAERVTVVGETERPPLERVSPAGGTSAAIARHVVGLVPEAAEIEVAPGPVGEAVLAALDRPVRLHSGVVGDGAVSLAERGLLLGEPRGSYVVGGAALYRWADGRPIAATIAETHVAGLAGDPPLVAVNTALELDEVGNVNAEGFGGDVVGGVGGLPDFASAAARSPRGLSVIALPGERSGRSTLVERLSAPPSLGRADVEVVVTERGVADLRGLADDERREALRGLWGLS
jgi:acyl-CoA hydrolase